MQVSNPPLISLRELVDLARPSKGQIHHIYLHWTAGRYEQFFDDYHLNIDGKGNVYQTCSQLTAPNLSAARPWSQAKASAILLANS